MKKIVLLLVLIGFNLAVNAQSKSVTGKVFTFETIPVQKASVFVKSTGKTVLTDTAGAFAIECGITDQLKLSAEGFSNRTVKIKKETRFLVVNLNLLAKESAKELAVGYGHVKDKNKLYALAGKNDNLKYSMYNNIYEILTGNFPGVQVINGDVLVRSSSSFSSSATALLVVDGREVNKASFASIVPSDILRISVLKDASASVYGSQGANGVVIVETKRGK